LTRFCTNPKPGRIRRGLLMWVVLVVIGPVWAGALQAQSRADSAAVLLHTAEQLRLRGEVDVARALLAHLSRQYAGTPAAEQVDRMLAALRRVPEVQRPGRTELLVWSTTYGAWLGVAVPLMADSDSPEAYGLGLLAGAPVGFFAARAYTARARPTEGQARAITFGGSWGTYQGIGWTEVFDIGARTETFCSSLPPSPDVCFESEGEVKGSTYAAAAVIGGLAGIGTGAYLARKPITAGTAAAVTLSGLWGSWFSVALSVIGGLEDDDLLAATLTGGNVALGAAALVAPRWEMSESRARLVSVGGLIGGLGGAGLLLIAQPDDEKVAISIPLATSIAGLVVAARLTRDMDAGPDDVAPGRGALLNLDGGRVAFDMPAVSVRLDRGANGRHSALHVPLLRARFQ
jgi:hypothetical protein